ncbi:MAG TPA: SpoIID/LytB domain-containing protein [Blastocatellia bacterium]|nr:SpoIID/LytB domain-containing protein [Blastocatellia bacterium]
MGTVSILACSPPPAQREFNVAAQPIQKTNEAELDKLLQKVSAEALGDREGAVIVIDPQTGRLRAVVNPRLAFEQAFPPGSAIKPFTALAALRAGLLDLQTRRQCQTKYSRDDFEIVCSHPRSNSPFNLAQALAYSCNDYFAHVGERLSEGTFNATLGGFGFGQKTGIAASEATGSLPRGEWRVQTALGDDDKFLVTPIQLMAAYVALVNGGHLYRPAQTSDAAFAPIEMARLNITAAHRTALIEGMRGAVKYGTAAKTELGKLPDYVFGKTGTSTASNGFRTQGWFAGFAADKRPTGVPAPEQVKLGVLVFLKRAHGSQAAEMAKAIFDCGLKSGENDRPGGEVSSEVFFHRRDTENAEAAQSFLLNQIELKNSEPGGAETTQRFSTLRNLCKPLYLCDENTFLTHTTLAKSTSHSALRNPQSVKVRSVSENVTRELPLEEYLVGVLAAEASVETQPEALKAQAVISRTFALRNPGRHAREGFDFCSTTHCQRFILPKARQYEAARRAVAATRGEVLRDRNGNVIDAYFHAACGGVTANLETLWGVEAPIYLRGVRDDFCSDMPHRRWEQTIPVAELTKALQSDERTNVGSQLKKLIVSKRDATGRAETITLEGERKRNVHGWDFKLIVGRNLGWQMVKSSRFDVERRGDLFVFRGSGFGHGLGLCQEGAHVMAERKMTYRQILSFYFPGTRLLGAQSAQLANPVQFAAYRLPDQIVQANEHFRLSFSKSSNPREAESVLRILETARRDLIGRLKTASLRWNERQPFEIVVHGTIAEFIAATGLSGWATGATRGQRIELQPLALLQKRGVLTTALRHELAHSVIEVIGNGSAPRWLAEGLCLHFASEAAEMNRIRVTRPLAREELERRLKVGASATEMRQLYAMAFREVQALIREKGEAYVWQLIAKSKGVVNV